MMWSKSPLEPLSFPTLSGFLGSVPFIYSFHIKFLSVYCVLSMMLLHESQVILASQLMVNTFFFFHLYNLRKIIHPSCRYPETGTAQWEMETS